MTCSFPRFLEGFACTEGTNSNEVGKLETDFKSDHRVLPSVCNSADRLLSLCLEEIAFKQSCLQVGYSIMSALTDFQQELLMTHIARVYEAIRKAASSLPPSEQSSEVITDMGDMAIVNMACLSFCNRFVSSYAAGNASLIARQCPFLSSWDLLFDFKANLGKFREGGLQGDMIKGAFKISRIGVGIS